MRPFSSPSLSEWYARASEWFSGEPAPPAFGKGKTVPESTASLFSRLFFQWLAPFLAVGASRPLERDDLWSLPAKHEAATISDRIEREYFSRVPPARRPMHFRGVFPDDDGEADRAAEKEVTALPESAKDASAPATVPSARNKRSQTYSRRPLLAAIHRVFFWRWWSAGFFKLCGAVLDTTTPLVTRLLLAWLTESYAYAKSGGLTTKPRGVGYGIGLAFALFSMQEASSMFTNHFFMLSNGNGLLVRSGIIGVIFRKSLRLSGRARAKHSVGQMTTMISTDASRLDLVSQFIHLIWISPLQIIIGIALVIRNLGPSALVGLGVLVLGLPLQFVMVQIMFRARKTGVQITDRRVRLTTEVLQGIRLIKFYAWEAFYAHQIGGLREGEVAKIRRVTVARAGMIATVTIVPVAASVLSFITYALSGHTLTPAIIFSSLQLFNSIRLPLLFLPLVVSVSADALVALRRIGTFLEAEELPPPYVTDGSQENQWAVQIRGSFVWETVAKLASGKFGGAKDKVSKKLKNCISPAAVDEKKQNIKASAKEDDVGDKGEEEEEIDNGIGNTRKRTWWKKRSRRASQGAAVLPTTASPSASGTGSSSSSQERDSDSSKNDPRGKGDNAHDNGEEEKPFELNDVTLRIKKGAFVAIVGRVGSGKSSLMQALIGEMRRVSGEVVFGGSVAYVPQQAWIMNATLRENILFGNKDSEQRFRDIIRSCSLEHDIDMLPHGDQTEIGEKGINLSGGQKARVSLARAVYADADVVLLDDPLSAVDAHVGKALLENCLLSGPLSSTTRILATHALHVLPHVDYIYVMDEGSVIEEGTYEELVKSGRALSRLVEEHGGLEGPDSDSDSKPDGDQDSLERKRDQAAAGTEVEAVDEKSRGPASPLMTEEERVIGAVALSVYTNFLKYSGGIIWAFVIFLLLVLMQGASVGNTLFLGFWTSDSIRGFAQGEYMGVYAGLGLAQALFTFCASYVLGLVCLYSSLGLFKAALMGVLRTPISFFDTTPMGRIISRLSKDQDTLDTQLSMNMFQFLSSFSNVIGVVALVFYTFPYLGIIFAPLTILYYIVSRYYRQTSVETKRLDSIMRSTLYAVYSETLTGLATVRAYRAQQRFVEAAEHGLDLENRAYYMTIAIQRWLSIRLDVFGNILVLGISLFAAGFRKTVDPSTIGVVLSYSLNITQTFSQMVSVYAQNEQNMNSVERILTYADLSSEGAATTANDPPPSWPGRGAVRFRNVDLAYRPGLPLVLKNVSFDVKPGEKIGIVGRTGAGKSSLLQALFRIVELSGGSIEIDGVDTSAIGLDVLRGRLALVPQDSTLFLGTLRENLDPQKTRTDAEILSALRRSWLLPPEGQPVSPAVDAKFSLDSAVGDEGSNYSAGEKQLLALCRALVKGSRVIVLDEATSNVDVETDAKIQRTIKSEFASCTLLCIAHRLNTILYYDRILVMNQGSVAEFDTPLNLFDRPDSILRSLCNEAGLTRQDILRIRGESTSD